MNKLKDNFMKLKLNVLLLIFLSNSFYSLGQSYTLYKTGIKVKYKDIPPPLGFIGGEEAYNFYLLKHKTDYYKDEKWTYLNKNVIFGAVWIKVKVDKLGNPLNFEILKEINGCPICTYESYFIIKRIKRFVEPKISGFNHYVFFIPY